MIGATSLLLETSPLSQEQQEYIGVIQGSSRSLMMLVNDILDLTRLQASKLRIENKSFSMCPSLFVSLGRLSLY